MASRQRLDRSRGFEKKVPALIFRSKLKRQGQCQNPCLFLSEANSLLKQSTAGVRSPSVISANAPEVTPRIMNHDKGQGAHRCKGTA
jgi:hypothetical protein